MLCLKQKIYNYIYNYNQLYICLSKTSFIPLFGTFIMFFITAILVILLAISYGKV